MMNLPNRIFAIGGAGKAIAFELLETEWVLQSILEPRPDPESLTVTIIDTAKGEYNTDTRRIRELRQKVREMEEDLRDTSRGRTGDIDITYKLITDDIQLNSSIDLVGDETVPRIAAGNGMNEDDWWLDENHINENLDFAKGVVRKRGLGKAIYYKAYAEDDSLSSVVDLPEKGQVAVIAGLGGGTGSGILLDLAQHLQRKQRTAEITLFGILPNTTEGLKENSNAFAALSEIENLALEGGPVFKDRVILPIDPTGFDGKTGDRIQTRQYLQELDQAFVYLLSSYYNTEGLEDPFAASPEFAPFTIGIPQVLRYNVEAISSARESVRDILNEKREALDDEEQIYSDVERFLDKHVSDGTSGDASLRDLDRTDLVGRLERTESLLDIDLFEELEYESVDVFKSVLNDAASEGEDIVERIEVIDGMLRTGATGSEDRSSYVDDIDELLAEIIQRELKLLVWRKELLYRKQSIEASQVRDSVEYFLLSGDDSVNPGVRLNRLEGKVEDLRERVEHLESDLEETTSELEEKRREVEQTGNREAEEWTRQVQEYLDQLKRLESVDPTRTIDSLDTELEQFRSEVVNADNPELVEDISVQGIRSLLDDLEESFREIGIDPADSRQAIDRSLTSLKNARLAFLNVHQEEGTVEKFLPWQSSTEQERNEAQKDYRMQKTQLDDAGVFDLGPLSTSFTAEVSFDADGLREQIHDREDELRQSILDSFRDQDLSEEYVDELRRTLGPHASVSEVKEIATRAFRDEVADTESVEERKTEIEDELHGIRDDLELYESATELFESVSSIRTSLTESREGYEDNLAEYRDASDRSVATEEDYVYIKSIKPDDLFRATGNDDLAASDLLKSNDETQRLVSNLEELAQNARNERYTGLRRRKLSKDGVRYDGLKIRLAVMSQVTDQLPPDTLQFRDAFEGSFDLGGSAKRVESPYTSWRENIGGDWDIGLTVFVDGVFLDNLRAVVDADGFFDGYSERLQELQEDIVVHHSYGLEDGYFVRRNDVMNLEDPEDVQFFLREDDKSITDALQSEYQTKVETGSAGVEDLETAGTDEL